jgi:hypothetical protein
MKKASLMMGLAAMMLPSGSYLGHESIIIIGKRPKYKRRFDHYTEEELFTILTNDLLEGKESDSIFVIAADHWNGQLMEFKVKSHNVKTANKKLIKLITYYRN